MIVYQNQNTRAYIVNFDKGGIFDTFNYDKLHTALTTAKGINSWFHYLECSYIFITGANVTAVNMYDFLKPLMGEKQFLILEVNLNNHNGWLPKAAWEWINKYKSGIATNSK